MFTILIFILFILTPVSLFSVLLYTQIQNFLVNFDFSLFDKWFAFFAELKKKLLLSYLYPHIQPYLDTLQSQLTQYLAKYIQNILQSLGNIFLATFGTILNIIFTLFALFYFLSEGDKIVSLIKELIPAKPSSKEEIINKISEILKAVLYGSILTSLVQGLVALVIYLILAIPQPFLFAFLTMLASYIPFFGTTLIWIPLSLYLLLTGYYFKAGALFLLCALTVAQIDNLLKPRIISGKTRIHNLLMFFSVLGGIYRFGITGLFLGPIILGLFLSILEIYRSKAFQENNSKEPI